MLWTAPVIVSLFFPLSGQAQAADRAGFTFDVTAIKPADPNARSSNLNLNLDRIVAVNLPLTFLLQFAYSLNSGSTDQIVNAPPWLESQHFDIAAKEDEATAAALGKLSAEDRTAAQRAMLRSLLEQRFGLKVHHEMRALPVFVLVVAKGGPRLVSLPPALADVPISGGGLHNPARGRTQGHAATIAMLVDSLSTKPEIGGRLVIDATGLKGSYNFDLSWTPEGASQESDATGPSLFTALQEQLGLKLESRRAPVNCLVIDHVEQPSPN